MRIADDYAAIRDRMEQLNRRRQERSDRTTLRDWKDDRLEPDRSLVEEVKKVLGRGRLRD